MKIRLIQLLSAWGIGLSCLAQPLPPTTTTYTRSLLRASSSNAAWVVLGLAPTNTVSITVTQTVTIIPAGTDGSGLVNVPGGGVASGTNLMLVAGTNALGPGQGADLIVSGMTTTAANGYYTFAGGDITLADDAWWNGPNGYGIYYRYDADDSLALLTNSVGTVIAYSEDGGYQCFPIFPTSLMFSDILGTMQWSLITNPVSFQLTGTVSGGAYSNASYSGAFAGSFSGVITNSYTINVESFGAKHDARRAVGGVTNSTSVKLTYGSVTTNDIGAFIRVRQGNNWDWDCVTTISNVIDSTHIRLAKVCSNSIAHAEITIANTDDTAAIQAALNSLASGGGTLLCPPGRYWIGGPVLDPGAFGSHYNAQLYISPVPPNSQNRCIKIHGYGPVNTVNYSWANSDVPANATVFECGLETGGLPGNPPGALLGSYPLATASGVWMGAVEVRDILFRLPTNPNSVGLDGASFASLVTWGCTFDTGVFAIDTNNIPQPHYQSIAVRYPMGGNYGSGRNRMDNGIVMSGFWGGVQVGEHFQSYGLWAICCMNAIVVNDISGGVDFFGSAIEECPTTLLVTNTGSIGVVVDIVNMRWENTLSGWWHNAQTLVNDPGNWFKGSVSGVVLGTVTNLGGIYGDYYIKNNVEGDASTPGLFSTLSASRFDRLLVPSNSWTRATSLNAGDMWLVSSNGHPFIKWVEPNGTQHTSPLVP